MNRLPWCWTLIVCFVFAGCGESQVDRFKRLAKARAAKRAAAGDTEPDAGDYNPNAGKEKKAEVAKQQTPAPEATVGAAKPDFKAKSDATAEMKAKPRLKRKDDDDDYNPAAAIPKSRRLARARVLAEQENAILAFSKSGEKVAYVGDSEMVGIYDVATKKLSRRIFNPQIKPSAVAIGEDAGSIVVGGHSGNFKVFSLESTEGLDRFQAARIRRIDARPARIAHQGPIKAIAIDESAQLIATGDTSGNISLWSSVTADDASSLRGGSDPYRQILSYQNGSKVFATTASELLYWNVASGRSNAVVLSKGWDHEPAVMVSGVGGKGLAVGDVSGQIRTWNSSANGLVEEVFTAHQDAVASLGFSPSGNEMISVSDRGEIISWSLPSGSETQSVGDSSSQTLRVSGDKIVSATVASDAAMVAICDGSPVIELVSNLLGKNAAVQNRSIAVEDAKVHRVAINPSGQSLAAITVAESDKASQLVVYGVSDGKEMAKQALPHDARELSYSDNGKVVAVTLVDNRVTVYRAETLEPLEVLGPIPGLQITRLADDGFRVLLGISDGSENGQSIRPMPLSSLGKAKASEAEIVSLDFLDDGKYLLSSDNSGRLSLFNVHDFDEPKVTLAGPQTPIVQSNVSSDGRYVTAVYQGDENSVRVWDIGLAMEASSERLASEMKPVIVIEHEAEPTSADFTSDSRCVLVGGTDGMIRAWNIIENRLVADFPGHQGPVVDIAPLADSKSFVSGGVDRAIRSWQFPANLPAPGANIPTGTLAHTIEVESVPRPTSTQELAKTDPLEAARQALISGAKTGEIVDLMNVAEDIKDKIKSSISAVMKSENDHRISAKDLSQRRRTLAKTQTRLDTSDQAQTLSTFADGFSNLTFVGESNFTFEAKRSFRPVKLLFADRFLYAARPSDGTTKPRPRRGPVRYDKEGDPIVVGNSDSEDQGDNGALLSWDYKFSRLQAHAWSIKDLRVNKLLAMPNGGGVFTVPQMVVFNQDGSSRLLGNAASWAKSNQPLPAKQYVAIGSAGAVRDEDNILTIFETDKLSGQSAAPTSQYRSYEGVVTAMTFAHNSPYIAFCVRERAVHRLFIADAQTLQLRKLEEVNHSQAWSFADRDLPEDRPGTSKVNPDAAQGINALAFSPDDSMLIAHGQYDKRTYKFSRWDLKWKGNHLVEFERSRKGPTRKHGPFFKVSSNKLNANAGEPIKFISRPLENHEKAPSDLTTDTRRTAGAVPLIVVQNHEGFEVINLNQARTERIVPYLKTQHGRPEFALSKDGRWLCMGDDNGKAVIFDLLDGATYSVTIDPGLERLVSDRSIARQTLRERPAHSGPVVGVALSQPDPGRDYPAFAATIGEENKVKVWELYPILDPEAGIRSRNWVPAIKKISPRDPRSRTGGHADDDDGGDYRPDARSQVRDSKKRRSRKR